MAKSAFVADLLDRLSILGDVKARAMFGGYGIYHKDVMFGLVADGVFYLKADEQNCPAFEAAGSAPFRYHRAGRRKAVIMSYWEAPPEVLEVPDRLRQWALEAHAAALRSR
jgi:DNA transformation protein